MSDRKQFTYPEDDMTYRNIGLACVFASVACGAACITAAVSSAPVLAVAFGVATAGGIVASGYFWLAHACRNLQYLS